MLGIPVADDDALVREIARAVMAIHEDADRVRSGEREGYLERLLRTLEESYRAR